MSNKNHTTDMYKGETMTTSLSTPPFSGTSSTVLRTPSNSPPLEIGMTRTSGLNDVDGANNFDHDEDDNISINDSNSGEGNTCRSTASGEGRSRADDSSIASRREELASKETRAVIKIKLLVFGSLFFSMVAVVLTAYFLTSQAEIDSFELHFYDDANKILGNMGQNLQRTMEASDAFIISITSYAARTNQTWPYVVIPDFSVTAEKVRSLCGAVYVTTYHFVENEQRKDWENFTAIVGTSMVNKAVDTIAEYTVMDWPISYDAPKWNVIYGYDEYDKENQGEEGVSREGPYLPMWQIQPTVSEFDSPYNWDLLTAAPIPGQERSAANVVMQEHKPVLSVPYLLADTSDPERFDQDQIDALWMSNYVPHLSMEEVMQPLSDFHFPVLGDAYNKIQWMDGTYSKEDHKVVAILSVGIYWNYMIRDVLPQGSTGILVVFNSACAQSFTYEVNGPDVVYLGAGEYHDPKYDHMTIGSSVSDLRFFSNHLSSYSGLPLQDSFCPMYVSVHASAKMEAVYTSNTPWIFALVTACVFLLTVLAFIVYNYVVEQRQKVVLKSAVTSNAIVSSLFPDAVKKQLMETQSRDHLSGDTLPNGKLKMFLNDGNKNDNTFDEKLGGTDEFAVKNAKQIAELFPETTIMFADISGFTAWASSREPCHVFTLLETLYGAFDRQAKSMGIFKVETIGDCYVAVCGLPEPNKHHALKMAKFASLCVDEITIITKKLELSLGPGTADLALRLGLHSGPTIAGVLRGEKARFQLFGDTVNTASRMESSSLPNKIQVSRKTAELIVEAGKGHWLSARRDMVNAKGKGLLQTYWLNPKRSKNSGSVVLSIDDLGTDADDCGPRMNETKGKELESKPFSAAAEIPAEKLQRLIDWNVELFEDLLKPIVIKKREKLSGSYTNLHHVNECILADGASVRNQVVATVRMSEFQPGNWTGEVELDPAVLSQLRLYITTVANMYSTTNAFHNFEHASHVIMSTVKLIQRVATRDVKKKDISNQKEYYDYTFGISTDPLTKFAIVFSALIHDLDHVGVSNGQLVKEQHPIAVSHDGLSPMEQHSFTVAFELLMKDNYSKLRSALYDTQEEFNRFRQLCINCVIATDVFDRDLQTFREERWNKAFAPESPTMTEDEVWHCKATITIEYIIQASDVAHTMQHWHVYQRWNKRLFLEMYAAYKAGRADRDPLEVWFGGELWFFDNYVIPLAKKLRECEVFGVDCDQLLDYATQNRMEWNNKGADIVKGWKEELEGK